MAETGHTKVHNSTRAFLSILPPCFCTHIFEAEMKSCHARTHSGSAGLYLEAEIGYIQRSEYDEDGDFDQGEIIDWFAASYQPEGGNE